MGISVSWLYLIIAIPAASAAVLLLGGKATNAWGHLLGTAASLASFGVGVAAFLELRSRGGDELAVGASGGSGETATSLSQELFSWIQVGGFDVQFGLLFDRLSGLFVLLITGVGSLIHIYSIGYMAHDERRRRFFAHLNLFIAAMLMLVLADDYLTVFLGWEGVGLASYLLIGFFQQKTSAAVAAKKAFVVNRVGDMGMALSIMLMFATFGTSSFVGVESGMEQVSNGTATALGLLLLLGACGKSAQVPLQSWLLDAMEGPTPVSALIHAATMVTAGVYLVTRSSYVYEQSQVAQTAVVIVGLVTLLWGAIIGCAKDDIKKGLAGSTMSQIGYMMLAAGIGPAAYSFAIFHLLTHGFFKANLFLGAGSVMHAMNDEVDMRRYGALRAVMPITFITFACGYLAIIGFPGFAGFWSKDKIIEAAFSENLVVGLGALLGAGITAFYMTRMMIMTFISEKRWAKEAHPHESSLVMTVPLMVLAVASVFGGVLLLNDWIGSWLEPVVGEVEHHELPLGLTELALTIVVAVVVLIGVGAAVAMYRRDNIAAVAPARVSALTTAARRDLYGDAFNEVALMRPGQQLTRGLALFDGRGVDGAVNGLAAAVGGSSGRIRRWQTGFVRSYALSMLGGSALVVLALLAVKLA